MTRLAKGRPKNRGSIRGRFKKLSTPTPRPVQWVPRALCTRIKRPGREADPAYSSCEAKNQCTCTSTPPFALKYAFTVTFISRDALRLPIVILFLKDSSPLRLVSDCTSRQCRLFYCDPNDSSTVVTAPARLHPYL